MNYYKAKIQYDGTNYFGFQWQKDIPTIQNDLNLSVQKLIRGKVTTMGASRTDSGVHAVEQIVKITSEAELDCESFLGKLNLALPSQIKCLSLLPHEGSFNPTTGSLSKEYRYLFTNTLKSSCNDQKFIANHPFDLNIELMRLCTQMIVGKNSFHNFCSAGSNVKTRVREISVCELTEVDPHLVLGTSEIFRVAPELKHCYQLRIVGNGFLKQMVRHLMSALWLVGSGRMSPEEFSLLLHGPLRTKRLWKVASPRGLYLYQFNYQG
jgi:tRNA pseudouridine38-40 synthase